MPSGWVSKVPSRISPYRGPFAWLRPGASAEAGRARWIPEEQP